MIPCVSVIMPVYNGERYLTQAVDSVLNQSFGDFECIILDDGSQDSTPRLLAGYQARDPRVVVYRFDHNQGLSSILNFGIHQAQGKYIARMDADDICLPDRFQEQVSYMDAHPEVGVCSTGAELIGERQGVKWQSDSSHDVIHARMLFVNAISHPTVMMRTAVLQKYALEYDPTVRYAQDYELWSRMITKTRFAKLPRIMLQYRFHLDQISARHSAQQLQMFTRIYRQLFAPFGIEATDDELYVHQQVKTIRLEKGFYPTRDFLQKVQFWLEKILRANRKIKLIAPQTLEAELSSRWTSVCYRYPGKPASIASSIFFSPLPFDRRIGVRKQIQLLRFLRQKVEAI